MYVIYHVYPNSVMECYFEGDLSYCLDTVQLTNDNAIKTTFDNEIKSNSKWLITVNAKLDFEIISNCFVLKCSSHQMIDTI